MHIYDGIIISIFIYYVFSSTITNKKKAKKIFIAISILHLIIVQGLRADIIGGDLAVYKIQYNTIQNMNIINSLDYWGFEPVYNIFTYCLSKLGVSFQLYLFIVSVFVLTGIGYFIYKYSLIPIISLLIYLLFGIYDFGFSGLRQIIAMTIILYAYKYIVKRKPVKYFSLIILASLIHTTAIIFIVFYFIINFTYIKKMYLTLLPIIIVTILLFGQQIANIGFNLLEISEGYMRTSYIDSFGIAELLIVFIVIIGTFLLIINNELKEDTHYGNFLIIMTFSLIVQLLAPYSYMFARLNLYFFQFLAIYATYLIKAFIDFVIPNNLIQKDTLKAGIFYLFLLCFITIVLIMYHNIMLQGPHQVYPHLFFWES